MKLFMCVTFYSHACEISRGDEISHANKILHASEISSKLFVTNNYNIPYNLRTTPSKKTFRGAF